MYTPEGEKPEENIRAIVLGLTQPERQAMLEALFSGEQASYYARILHDRVSPIRVAATSVENAYEMVLSKPNQYVGEAADFYMLRELKEANVRVNVVSGEEFAEHLDALGLGDFGESRPSELSDSS